MRRRLALGQERAALAQDERIHVARRRRLLPLRIDEALAVGGHGLVRRHRIDGEEAGRMAGQPVEADHAQPPVRRVERARPLPCGEPGAQRGEAGEHRVVEEDAQVVEQRAFRQGWRRRNLGQPRGDLLERGRREARGEQHGGERVDVGADRPAARQRGLQGRRAASHEGVVNRVARPGQPLDEEGRKLRLETGPVADLVQPARAALTGGPELVGETGDAVSFGDTCGASPIPERRKVVRDAIIPVRHYRPCKSPSRAASAPLCSTVLSFSQTTVFPATVGAQKRKV